jgi:hypothetical protein
MSDATRLPFSLEDASRPEPEFTEDSGFSKVNLDTRLNHRVIDLRVSFSFFLIKNILRIFLYSTNIFSLIKNEKD